MKHVLGHQLDGIEFLVWLFQGDTQEVIEFIEREIPLSGLRQAIEEHGQQEERIIFSPGYFLWLSCSCPPDGVLVITIVAGNVVRYDFFPGETDPEKAVGLPEASVCKRTNSAVWWCLSPPSYTIVLSSLATRLDKVRGIQCIFG